MTKANFSGAGPGTSMQWLVWECMHAVKRIKTIRSTVIPNTYKDGVERQGVRNGETSVQMGEEVSSLAAARLRPSSSTAAAAPVPAPQRPLCLAKMPSDREITSRNG